MILDVELPPKSLTSSGPTVRQTPGSSVTHPLISYATFPETNHNTQPERNGATPETRPLLYHSAQSVFDDVEPPAYEEVSTPPKHSASQNRLWIRCAAALLVLVLVSLTLYSYDLSIVRRRFNIPTDIPNEQLPPGKTEMPPSPTSPPSRGNPSPAPSVPSLPLPPLSPLPPTSPIPDLPDLAVILPVQGRTDLCFPWAYSSKPGLHPLASDNRPIDKLVYTVPTLAPIHLETSAICPTPEGTTKFCDQYDETYDSIAGKLQVVGADIDLPRIEITVQHGSVAGQDNVAVCLMKRSDENGGERWLFGLYAWKDPTGHGQDSLLASMSIIVTLPRTRVHSLSTELNYFAQTIGPEVKMDSNALVFDTLQARLGERGSLTIRNVTAATIETTAFGDMQTIQDTRVTKMLQMRSDTGFISCSVSLVHDKGSSPAQIDLHSNLGTVAVEAALEYPSLAPGLFQFSIKAYSAYSPAMILVRDPQGTSLLRQNPHLNPPLPTLRLNATSSLSIAQVSVPATYQGKFSLNSKHAAIVTVDHAKNLMQRFVSWDRPKNGGYRGHVRWAGREEIPGEAGSIVATTEYASARLLFLGLEDDDIKTWPENDSMITYNRTQS